MATPAVRVRVLEVGAAHQRTAFAEEVEGSAFVPIVPEVTLPFDLLWRPGRRSGALNAVLRVARSLDCAY